MRERDPFVCSLCGKKVTRVRVISKSGTSLVFCLECHHDISEGYSELEIIGVKANETN